MRRCVDRMKGRPRGGLIRKLRWPLRKRSAASRGRRRFRGRGKHGRFPRRFGLRLGSLRKTLPHRTPWWNQPSSCRPRPRARRRSSWIRLRAPRRLPLELPKLVAAPPKCGPPHSPPAGRLPQRSLAAPTLQPCRWLRVAPRPHPRPHLRPRFPLRWRLPLRQRMPLQRYPPCPRRRYRRKPPAIRAWLPRPPTRLPPFHSSRCPPSALGRLWCHQSRRPVLLPPPPART